MSQVVRRGFEKEAGNKFSLRTPDDIGNQNEIKVLLVDTAMPDSSLWLSKEKLEQMPNLELVQSTRAGVDSLRFEDIPENVLVCGNIGAYGEQIAEHIFGMILYFARNLGKANEELKQGIWKTPESTFLNGKNFLSIGTGGIGQSAARLAKCFGMKTYGVNFRGRPSVHFDRTLSEKRINSILGVADVVVVATPLTVKTFHMIDSQKLSQMKRNCILVNVARGYTIDERALYDHMKQNPEFRCGLDVWWNYPKPGEKFAQDFPFFDLPNFLGSPHDSGIVPETEEIAALSAIENIGRFSKKRPLRGLMNREDYVGLKQLIASSKQTTAQTT